MKANGINPNGGRDLQAGCPSSSPNPAASDEEGTISKPPAKRRKRDHFLLKTEHEEPKSLRQKVKPEPEPELEPEVLDNADCTAGSKRPQHHSALVK